MYECVKSLFFETVRPPPAPPLNTLHVIVSSCGFIYLFLCVIINEVEHLIIRLLDIWISSLVKCLFKYLAFYFKISFQTVSIPAPTHCRTIRPKMLSPRQVEVQTQNFGYLS